MNKQSLLSLILATALGCCASVAIAQPPATNAASAPTAPPIKITPETVLISGPVAKITVADVEKAVDQMIPPRQQAMIWLNPQTPLRIAQDLYFTQALSSIAIKEKLDATPEAQDRLKFNRNQTLARILMDARMKESMPDDKAVKAYANSEIKAHPELYQTPEQIEARHILLPVAANNSDEAAVKSKALELMAQLNKGADFATLAQANSKDPGSAQKGGLLDYFSRGKMVKPFEDAAFGLKKPGQIAGPIRTQFGFHIIKLVDRKPAAPMPEDQVMKMMREQLSTQRQNQAVKDITEPLKAAMTINQDTITEFAQQQAVKHKIPLTP